MSFAIFENDAEKLAVIHAYSVRVYVQHVPASSSSSSVLADFRKVRRMMSSEMLKDADEN